MQNGQNLNDIVVDAIGQEITRPGYHNLTGSGDSAGAARTRKMSERNRDFKDTIDDSLGSSGALLEKIMIQMEEIGSRSIGPLNLQRVFLVWRWDKSCRPISSWDTSLPEAASLNPCSIRLR